MELSVCMIVKNEQHCIENILSCAKKFADEIVVVDTGSTDKTKQICKKYGAKIFDFKWENNFAKARNFSFSKATKPFLMWLDADDFVDEKNIQKILEIKNRNVDFDCMFFKYAMGFDSQNNPQMVFFRERILKRSMNFEWKGFVHEAIEPKGKILFEDVVIQHQKQKPKNPKRNLKIFYEQKRLGATFSAREQYYFSKELFYNGFLSACQKNMKKFLRMQNKFLPNVLDGVLTILKCFNAQNKPQKAIDFGLDFAKENVLSSEICCEIAQSFLMQEKPLLAKNFFELALTQTPNEMGGNFVLKDFYYFVPHVNLCVIYYHLGDFEKAKKHHMLAKKQKPNSEIVLFNEKFFQKN